MEYASVTAPASVTGKSITHDSSCYYWSCDWNRHVRSSSEASHEVIFILLQAFVAYHCRQKNAVKNKVSIQQMNLFFSDTQHECFTYLLNYVGWKCALYLVLPIFHYTFFEYFSLCWKNDAENISLVSILGKWSVQLFRFDFKSKLEYLEEIVEPPFSFFLSLLLLVSDLESSHQVRQKWKEKDRMCGEVSKSK